MKEADGKKEVNELIRQLDKLIEKAKKVKEVLANEDADGVDEALLDYFIIALETLLSVYYELKRI